MNSHSRVRTTTAKSILLLKLPPALGAEVRDFWGDSFPCFYLLWQVAVVTHSLFLLAHACESFLNQTIWQVSCEGHVLDYLYFFSLGWQHVHLGLRILVCRTAYLELSRWGSRAYKRWLLPHLFLFLQLDLLYRKWRRLVHGVFANRDVSFRRSLVEISLAVRTRHICKHLAALVDV